MLLKKTKEISREHPTARRIRVALTVLLASLGVLFILGGIFLAKVGSGIDYAADLELLADFSGNRTTILYGHRDGFDPDAPTSETDYDPIELDRICGAEDRVWLAESELPALVRNAFIAIEDKRFYRHEGVDWLRTGRAALNSVLRLERRFGGSTITQQLIKNVSGESEATAGRKVREILRATALEKSLSKDEILAYYLNIIPLANRCYGVGAAARYYFGKKAAELLPEEAAALAAITNAPARYDPVRNPEANRRRRDLILSEMERQGYLGRQEAEAARERDTVLHLTELEPGKRVHGWYTEAVIRDVIRDLRKKLGISEKSAEAMLYGGGLSIRTFCAAELQDAADRYFDRLSEIGEKGASAAFVLIDPRNGALLAVRGASGKKEGNRLLSYASDALRPPGSALKPLALYAPALKARLIHYGTVLEDLPVDGAWPHNTPNVYDGRMPICKALASSKNTVAVRLYQRLGAQTIADALEEDYGLRGLRRGGTDGLTDLAPAPLALGQLTDGVSLVQLTAAYTVFAADGTYHSPRTYLSVYDRNGKCLLENRGGERRVLSPEDAYIMTELLRGVVDFGTASGMGLRSRVEIAGKTGTSGDSLDRWFVGYTPYLLGGILICGNGSSLSGSGLSQTELWDNLMSRFHSNLLMGRQEIARFPIPEGIIRADFCADSGQIPTEACRCDPRADRILSGPFTADNLPSGFCDTHVLLGYDRLHGVYRKVEDSLFPFLLHPRSSALRDENRQLPQGIEVTDRSFDLSVVLGQAEQSRAERSNEGKRFRFFRH